MVGKMSTEYSLQADNVRASHVLLPCFSKHIVLKKDGFRLNRFENNNKKNKPVGRLEILDSHTCLVLPVGRLEILAHFFKTMATTLKKH
tara:strand:+ start:91 stop:357 length:267 start_codon:yes stop_codon:yes gene_type:complete